MCKKIVEKDVIVCDLCGGEFYPEDKMTFIKTREGDKACEYCYEKYADECDTYGEY